MVSLETTIMKIDSTLFNIYILLILGLFQGCSDPPPSTYCHPGFYADGIKEEFCIDRTETLVTRIIMPDSLSLQHQFSDSVILKSSSNYLGYLFSTAIQKPDALTLDDEIEFYHDLQLLMQPGSIHGFDISEAGEFAFELFDHEGNYFSTELANNQNQPTMKVLSSFLSLNEPDEFRDYTSRLILQIEVSGPIILSNQDATENRNIEFDSSVTFLIDIAQII